ncbi:Gfo/Idh/MocA family oxidoreductase [Maribacter polysiphoniae]|uniref:Gfo/Idh/MocA family oxidoreductase n=1 Tax=Maribacter polysiphoniae TaxID=429344 RepID=A0A316ERT6_9FLAO|nr:Gfo/Idh/MocA family oxidoreductase [Maribacter polysiphoniae]MBD1260357.1 Gfo/Idh/MocA family oxidoreductase [Maribacter polysiphoniae]PWK25820.1 putative dehydrogenase [Maribacter polysiphoniae]
MKEDKNIRWGIIGCGAVTEVKSGPAYQNTEGFEVRAVMRRNKEKAADYAKRHGIAKFYTNADDLIADEEIDAVYIATPPDSHKAYALKVAAAGKPCCIEKPMAPNYSDSLEIHKAFNDKKLPLFIAYYRRSLPRFDKVKEWLNDGKIGEVRQICWQLSKQPNDSDLSGEYNWRTDAKIAPGGYFDDLASHGLDLFVHLLGDISEASGIATNQMGLYTAKDAIMGQWKHESGVLGSGSWNFGCYEREDKVEIYGSKGKIIFSVFDEAPIILINPNGEEKLEIENPKHIQQFHVANIKNHLLGVKEHPSLGKSGLHASWVMDRILGNI